MNQRSALLGVFVPWVMLSMALSAEGVSKINGVMYADYYHVFRNHSRSAEGQNAFAFRRIYFTFENNITRDLKIRFRLESAHDKVGSSNKINPFVKHAYLEWTHLIPSHQVYFGIGETNGFKNAEALWGYRSVEKTIMDLNKIQSSADMGIGIKGNLSQSLHHWLTLHNGTGYGSAEADKYKRIGYAFWVTPAKGLILEAYADYEKQDAENPAKVKDYAGAKGYYTLRAFAGYSVPAYRAGVEWFRQTRQQSGAKNPVFADEVMTSVAKADVVKSGYSLWGACNTPVPRLKLFARYDRYDPNSNDAVYTGVNGSLLTGHGLNDEHALIIAGLDYSPASNVHFMPTLIHKSYAKNDVGPDLTVRITMYVKFGTGNIIVE